MTFWLDSPPVNLDYLHLFPEIGTNFFGRVCGVGTGADSLRLLRCSSFLEWIIDELVVLVDYYIRRLLNRSKSH